MKIISSYKSLLFLLFFLPIFLISCDKDKTLIPDSAKKELSNRTIVQTKWSNEEERVDAHRKRVVESRGSTSSPMAPAENTSESFNTDKKPLRTGLGGPMPTGKYTLQLGAFSNAANANRLVKKLREQNYIATVSVFDKADSKLHIVKMGPFKDRVTASEKAAVVASYINLGVAIYVKNRFVGTISPGAREETDIEGEVENSSVVEGETTKDFTRMSGQSFNSSTFANYSFQIGGLYSLQDAQEQRKILEAKGYKLHMKKIVSRENNETWYSIRIGYFESYVAAGDAAYFFSEKEGIPAQALQKQLGR